MSLNCHQNLLGSLSGMVENGYLFEQNVQAALAQLGERQTEDLKAPCSIHGGGNFLIFASFIKHFNL